MVGERAHAAETYRLTSMPRILKRIFWYVAEALWKRLPLKRKVLLLEAEPLQGALDWDKNILLSVSSLQDIRRLYAAKSEPYTAFWITKDMRDGDCLYDIGASVGAYSFIAARAHKKVTAYAFEPSAASFVSLLANVARNDFGEKIIPLSVALSEKTGFTEFAYSSLSSGATKQQGIGAPTGSAGAARQIVYAWALDDLVAEAKLKPPTHIKIDVDGYEVGVLQGMKRTLASPTLRLVQVEASQGNIGTAGEVAKMLSAAGFSVAETNRADNLRATDYLFRRAAVI